jgi:hypothetical protein
MPVTCPHCHATVRSTSQPERDDTTLYLDRSKVREIVIGHNAATQAVLSKIDALPIFAAEDFRALAATPAVGGEVAAWRVEWIDGMLSFSISEPWNDPSTVKSITPLYAAPPASPLRGREALLTIQKMICGEDIENAVINVQTMQSLGDYIEAALKETM